MDIPGLFRTICVSAPPVLLAITAHEMAHAYAAYRLGDSTALRAGRLSLNPFRHIDVFGTLLLPALMVFMGLPGFGWAKPVPINAACLRNPKRDMFWVAAAGPASNALMAAGWLVFLRLLPVDGNVSLLKSMCGIGVGINFIMTAVNLLPVPPLDGGRIAISLLPLRWAVRFARIEPFGLFIVIALVWCGFFDKFLFPLLFRQFAFLF
ncbi:MAG: site-2 protease family protein [Candidatus Accumulibacter sp.]|nr:site-2 protease family protein [Accumulibacter sp.]